MPASKEDQLGPARALFAQGYSIAEIAELLDTSESTVYRYRGKDEKNQGPWDPDQYKHSAGLMLANEVQLDQRLNKVLSDSKRWASEPNRQAQTTQMLAKARETLRQLYSEEDHLLVLLPRFSHWCAEKLDGETLDTARGILGRFTADIKEAHS